MHDVRDFITVIVLTLASNATAAQLTFDRDVLELSPAGGVTEISAIYHFTQTGTDPVRIVSARSACSCTVASLDRDLYQPGERGVISAVFTVGNLTGDQIKTIQVVTEPADDPPIRLTLKVHLASPSVDRPWMLWPLGQRPVAQAVRITLPPDGSYTFLDAMPRGNEFLVSDPVQVSPFVYDITVTPRSADVGVEDVIDVRTRPASTCVIRIQVAELGADGRPLRRQH